MSISTEKQLKIEKSQSKIKIKICTSSWSLYYVTLGNKVAVYYKYDHTLPNNNDIYNR